MWDSCLVDFFIVLSLFITLANNIKIDIPSYGSVKHSEIQLNIIYYGILFQIASVIYLIGRYIVETWILS